MIVEILLALALTALWVAAWLHWFFQGELRHFLFAYIFPKSWRAGVEKDDLVLLDEEDFELFLNAESQAPGFIRGVLSCPGCFSAYVSAVGLTFAFLGVWLSPLFLLPLIWAGAAWIGHRLFHHA